LALVFQRRIAVVGGGLKTTPLGNLNLFNVSSGNRQFMLTTVIPYIISLFVIILVGWIGEFLAIFIIPIFHKRKVIYILFRFIYATLLSFISVYILVILLRDINYPISIFMVMLPMLLNITYDRSRILKVKTGRSSLLLKLKNEDKENDYNKNNDLWFEYSSFYGHLTGFINSIFFFLVDKSFF